jgi:hypothetical protein
MKLQSIYTGWAGMILDQILQGGRRDDSLWAGVRRKQLNGKLFLARCSDITK